MFTEVSLGATQMSPFIDSPRLVLRRLWVARGVGFVAVVTLALGIGACGAVFGAINTVLLQPIGATDLQGLVVLESDIPSSAVHRAGLTAAEVYDLGARRDLFSAVAGYRSLSTNLTGRGEPQRVSISATVGPFFRVLGARPYIGRLYDSVDARAGGLKVVVLSYEFWQATFEGSPRAIGSILQLNDSSYQVVGVLPPRLAYPRGSQLWTPHVLDPLLDREVGRCCAVVNTIARVKAGLPLSVLRSRLVQAMDEWSARYPQFYPAQIHRSLTVTPASDAIAGQLRAVLWMLFCAVGLVLLIACANVANILVVRTSGRAKEFAVRAALGASRPAILGVVASESVVLAFVSGVLGIGVAQGALAIVGRSDAAQDAGINGFTVDWYVLLFVGVATIGVALAVGAMPAWRAASTPPVEALRAAVGRTASTGVSRGRFLLGAVVGQVALALVLGLSALVIVLSTRRILAVNPGFRPDGLLTMQVALPDARYSQAAAKLNFANEALDKLRALPGVNTVGIVVGAPFSGISDAEHRAPVRAVGDASNTKSPPLANMWVIDGGYFRAMGIPLKRGRAFNANDNATGQRVVIIDEVLANDLFPGQDAIGRELDHLGVIVGVVGAVKKMDLITPAGASVYLSFGQAPLGTITFVIRTTRSADEMAAFARSALRDIDPRLPVFGVSSMSSALNRSIAPRRLAGDVLVALAILAVVLATSGVYGLLNYVTSLRTKEYAIRLALGAHPKDVVVMVLQRGLAVAAFGIAGGILMFVVAARLLRGLLYGVVALNPWFLLSVSCLVTILVLFASAVPAWRVGRTSLVGVLQQE